MKCLFMLHQDSCCNKPTLSVWRTASWPAVDSSIYHRARTPRGPGLARQERAEPRPAPGNIYRAAGVDRRRAELPRATTTSVTTTKWQRPFGDAYLLLFYFLLSALLCFPALPEAVSQGEDRKRVAGRSDREAALRWAAKAGVWQRTPRNWGAQAGTDTHRRQAVTWWPECQGQCSLPRLPAGAACRCHTAH
ncbi:hypothetical protein DPEC_G00270390 [Dallia pectoralis]|uniref:Uncharacterized protein n=1 Tax=Dallia pectoralis TaxID=75939 RepID=A0ACC2FPF7_DALPE|nr:hypothetical protein DPEC_G00270390 [Dallia pectoralis]